MGSRGTSLQLQSKSLARGCSPQAPKNASLFARDPAALPGQDNWETDRLSRFLLGSMNHCHCYHSGLQRNPENPVRANQTLGTLGYPPPHAGMLPGIMPALLWLRHRTQGEEIRSCPAQPCRGQLQFPGQEAGPESKSWRWGALTVPMPSGSTVPLPSGAPTLPQHPTALPDAEQSRRFTARKLAL